MKLKPPGRRKAKRINNRARKLAKFQQSKVGKLFQRDKPKGFRGHQAISRSNSEGLVGKLKIKQKLQDVFTKEGHSTCPEFTVDKNGNKKCSTGGGGNVNVKSGDSKSNTPETTIPSKPSASFGGNMGWGDFSFKSNINTNLPGFGIKGNLESDVSTGSNWHAPLKADGNTGGTGLASGNIEFFSKDGNSAQKNKSSEQNEVVISDEFSDENKKRRGRRVVKANF